MSSVVISGNNGDDTSRLPQRSSSSKLDLDEDFAMPQKFRGCPHALECLGCNTKEGHPVKLLFLEHMDVGDFGLSRVYDQRYCCMSHGHHTTRGTYSHMALEVAEGRGAEPALDVWSLGCTIVEMMQAVGPWDIGEEALLRQRLAEPPQIPSYQSRGCKDFIRRCLARGFPTAGQPCKSFFSICTMQVAVKAINISS
ncbi:hypothetical protein L7F22_045397 [Adiantum nelumboides]|nr:hypothetical protein [Adiantum nelumboides]